MEQTIETATAKPARRYARKSDKATAAAAPARPTSAKPSAAQKPAREKSPPRVTKADIVTGLLARPCGATIPQMCEATGWQQHSVRGFLAGKVKKLPGASLASDKTDAGRVYRLTSGDPVRA